MVLQPESLHRSALFLRSRLAGRTPSHFAKPLVNFDSKNTAYAQSLHFSRPVSKAAELQSFPLDACKHATLKKKALVIVLLNQ